MKKGTKSRFRKLIIRILDARYVFFALLFHIILLILFGGHVIYEAIEATGYIQTEGELFSRGSAPPPPPPSPSQQAVAEVRKEAQQTVKPTEAVTAPIVVNRPNADFSITVPEVQNIDTHLTDKTDSTLSDAISKAEVARVQEIRKTVTQWQVEGGRGSNAGKTVKAKFICYIGKYAEGDWFCNSGEIFQGRFIGNCIANLMLQVKRWTQGRVEPDLKPQPIALSSDELLRVRPPFVFLTGHKNFTFTNEEVDKLREYLLVGGCIWADNSLPGRRSRFDVAFRREMKRVLPDREFEVVPLHHPIFNSFYKLNDVPSGMNFYREPLEMVRIGDEIAVIYSLNAYSDLWQTGFNEKNQVDTASIRDPDTGAIRDFLGPHWGNPLYFRNVNEDSVRNAYRLGINIMVHLLIRFQDKMTFAPG